MTVGTQRDSRQRRPESRASSSSLNCESRDDTQLLHQVEQRRDAPMLGDPAVDDPHGVDRIEN